jgi:hypothetical protein
MTTDTIQPINYRKRIDETLAELARRHEGARYKNMFHETVYLCYPNLVDAKLWADDPTWLGFWKPLKIFSTLPPLLRMFFRVKRNHLVALAEKCEVFDTMMTTAPHLLAAVSNGEALLKSWRQRREVLNAEVDAYVRDLRLVEAIYWTDRHEKLGVDLKAFSITGDLTTLVSLIEARDALGEANPKLLPALLK